MESINLQHIAIPAIRSNADMSELSRRDFLKLVTTSLLTISGALGVGALFRFLDYQTEPPVKTEFDLGPASNYPIGSRSLIPDAPAVLIHNQNGFAALSLVCTHLGCTVEQKGDGFACPCHGSHYDENGKVLRGPAQQPLRVLHVEVNPNGNLVLYTN